MRGMPGTCFALQLRLSGNLIVWCMVAEVPARCWKAPTAHLYIYIYTCSISASLLKSPMGNRSSSPGRYDGARPAPLGSCSPHTRTCCTKHRACQRRRAGSLARHSHVLVEGGQQTSAVSCALLASRERAAPSSSSTLPPSGFLPEAPGTCLEPCRKKVAV